MTTSTFNDLQKNKESANTDSLCLEFIDKSLNHCKEITNLAESEIKVMIASRKINTLYNHIIYQKSEKIKSLVDEILE